MSIKLLVDAMYNGSHIAAGETITLDDEYETQLIKEGSAEVADATVSMQNINTNDTVEPTAEELESVKAVALVKKALDNQYKREELAEAAKTASVEFAFDATKAVIIDAVVEQGKAEALLK